ncbi:MAG: mechanosensitive ion channel [Burkholderiaceae bacterium]|nr:mechanosensitive ion channel [Microbacteriaceae bacterium]
MRLAVTDPAPFDWTAFWGSVGEFIAHFEVFFSVSAIIIGAVVLRILLHFVIRRVVNRVVSGVKKRQNVDDTQAIIASPLAAVRVVQRTRTLGSVLNNVVSVVIVIVALLLSVTAINPNIIGSFALITAALGAGLGFGAQNIVKDVLNGLFMVAEDQLGVGDVVDLGEAVGTVEQVGIRVTQVRDVDGTLWFVRNGEILRVGNKSQGWARVIIDIPAPYDSDVQSVQDTLLKTAIEMASSQQWRRKIIEKPEIWGLESISAEALVIRLVMKTRPADQWEVARELRYRLIKALDLSGVNLPALNRVVFDGQREPAAAPIEAPDKGADENSHESPDKTPDRSTPRGST